MPCGFGCRWPFDVILSIKPLGAGKDPANKLVSYPLLPVHFLFPLPPVGIGASICSFLIHWQNGQSSVAMGGKNGSENLHSLRTSLAYTSVSVTHAAPRDAHTRRPWKDAVYRVDSCLCSGALEQRFPVCNMEGRTRSGWSLHGCHCFHCVVSQRRLRLVPSHTLRNTQFPNTPHLTAREPSRRRSLFGWTPCF